MNPLLLGILFIAFTIVFIAILTLLYANKPTNPPGIAPTLVQSPGLSCNATDTTNPLCDATLGLQCINNTCYYGVGATCTQSSQCSVYPTVGGTPVTGAVQMSCLNSDGTACSGSGCKCYVTKGNPCVGTDIIPAGSGVVQCQPSTQCLAQNPSAPTLFICQ